MWDPFYSKIACLYRYNKKIDYHWAKRKLHCGRIPVEAYTQPGTISSVRILHLGYAQKADHISKYNRYLTVDPQGKFCPLQHYQSILRPQQLKQWNGEKIKVING
jgi:hypothetical protein